MKLKTTITGICLFAVTGAFAHDFEATVGGKRLFFDITGKEKKTVTVTFNGSITEKNAPEVSGILEIPAKVKHDSTFYEVKGIGPKAFAGATRLKGVVIPSGVETIGDFAFEGCDSLASVVFPGNPVTLGQGLFFRCPAIADVTLGSDWKTVNLALFRWSDSLKSITIPAKVEIIQGVKKLKGLESISVDPNNPKFSATDGMLYSKDGSTLYACPRGKEGKVTVREGTVKILDGALIDCVRITSLDLPSSLREVSFRETSRMKGLGEIAMRGKKPVVTGYQNGTGKFLFQLANPKARIIVQSDARKAYEEALATEPGEYSEKPDGVPYIVTKAELPSKKLFKFISN